MNNNDAVPERVKQARALLESIFTNHNQTDAILFHDVHALSAALMHIQLLQQSLKHAQTLCDIFSIADPETHTLLSQATQHLWVAAGYLERDDVKSGKGGVVPVMANYEASEGLKKSELALEKIAAELALNRKRNNASQSQSTTHLFGWLTRQWRGLRRRLTIRK